MLNFEDLGQPLKFEVDQEAKQKAKKFMGEFAKPINITPEQPSKQQYEVQGEDR